MREGTSALTMESFLNAVVAVKLFAVLPNKFTFTGLIYPNF